VLNHGRSAMRSVALAVTSYQQRHANHPFSFGGCLPRLPLLYYAGTDFIIAEDGRIAAVYLFFDKLP
jgi:hypothetical protein